MLLLRLGQILFTGFLVFLALLLQSRFLVFCSPEFLCVAVVVSLKSFGREKLPKVTPKAYTCINNKDVGNKEKWGQKTEQKRYSIRFLKFADFLNSSFHDFSLEISMHSKTSNIEKTFTTTQSRKRVLLRYL